MTNEYTMECEITKETREKMFLNILQQSKSLRESYENGKIDMYDYYIQYHENMDKIRYIKNITSVGIKTSSESKPITRVKR